MSNESDQFYFDIFVCAMEGGINYWASRDIYHHSTNGEDDLLGFKAAITEMDDYGPGPQHIITRQTIVDGVREVIGTERLPHETVKMVVDAKRYWDAGDIDADLADIIVQFGVLGDVIYG